MKAKILIECRNPRCPYCKGTGIIKIDSPTDGRDLSATCYGDAMAITESKPVAALPQGQEDRMQKLLQEARNLLACCSLLDKSGQCDDMVGKIDAFFKAEPK